MVTVIGLCYGYLTLTAGEYTAVTTLDSEFRPQYDISFSFHFMGGNPCGHVGKINTNGVIELYVTEAKNYWGFSVSYPVD